MRKKLAIFANGWSDELLQRLLQGIRNVAIPDLDIFTFLSYDTFGSDENVNQGEINIFTLPVISDYDAVIILANIMNSTQALHQLVEKVRLSKVPAVSVGIPFDGLMYVGVDDLTGMRDLVSHLLDQHDIKDVVFIGGTPDHVDSNRRLEITKEEMQKRGLTLDDSHIFYGNWGYINTVNIVHDLYTREEGLPDAIICANDVTALAALSHLTEVGVNLPDTVAVTGYDCIQDGRFFYPSLTSVQQDYSQVGEMCYKLLFDNADPNKEYVATSKMIPGESCGCLGRPEHEQIRKDFCSSSYTKHLQGEFLIQMERAIEQSIVNSKGYTSLKDNLCNHYLQNNLFEGEDFYIVLNSDLFKSVLENFDQSLSEGYQGEMSVLVPMRDKQILDIDRIEASKIVPCYESETQAHTYYVLPLHHAQYSVGYVVVVDDPLLVQRNILYPYASRVLQALYNLRVNIRLDILNKNLMTLYNKDAMTGLFNRFGYENLAIPMFKKSIEQNKLMMVGFVDINHMKYINDKFGHLQGDATIVTVADAIRKNEKDEWIGIRYGGDEFLILTFCENENEAKSIKKGIIDSVNVIARKNGLAYHPSISCGYVMTDPKSDKTLQDYIKEADDMMYEIKRELHAKEGR